MRNPQKILLPIMLCALCAPRAFGQNEPAQASRATSETVLAADNAASATLAAGALEQTLPTSDSAHIEREQAIEWLRKIEKKHQTIQRIVAEFHQQKTSNMFLEKIESDGVMYYAKPDGVHQDRMKIEYLTPNELHNWIVGDKIRIYNPAIKQGDIYDLSHQEPRQRRINKMLLGFGASVDDLLACFDIRIFDAGNEKQIGIRFVPLPEFKEQLFKECHLWLNKELLEPVQFEILDEQQDQTSIVIKKISWNSEIADSVFVPNAPKDVEWIERD